MGLSMPAFLCHFLPEVDRVLQPKPDSLHCQLELSPSTKGAIGSPAGPARCGEVTGDTMGFGLQRIAANYEVLAST
jgi:hypothetical protein